MIQPNYSFAHGSEYARPGYNTPPSQPVAGADHGDEAAFRAWVTRRETARQQIRRLSRRELQVVTLVAHGLANKSIAQELEISVKTIEKHRANAARKLGVNSTAELVRLSVLADQDSVIIRDRAPIEHPAAQPQMSHEVARSTIDHPARFIR